MLENATALPEADPAVASGQPADPALTEAPQAGAETPEAEAKPEAKPEKTPEQREIERLRRGIDRRTRQLAEARARIGLTQQPIEGNNRQQQDDGEILSLTKAQLAEIVKSEAAKLAPTLKQQAAEVERRQGVVQSLEKAFGKERFDELADHLDSAFDGLADAKGVPRPAVEAIFEADDPAKVIEYLADPDHDDEAEAISRMSAVQAGKAIAKLEAKLAAEADKGKPQRSNAAKPLEAIRGSGGAAENDPSTMTDPQFAAWRRKQIAQRR